MTIRMKILDKKTVFINGGGQELVRQASFFLIETTLKIEGAI